MKKIFFRDTHNTQGVIHLSSSINESVWFGVEKPEVVIMWKDAKKAGLNLTKKFPETNECGWCDLPLPDGTMVISTLHIPRRLAKILAKEFRHFSKTGNISGKWLKRGGWLDEEQS